MNDRLAIREDILGCTRCELSGKCRSPVPFFGPVPNRLAVLGEAPGEQEDLKGQPFIGPAGQLARKHMSQLGLDPEGFTWVNTVSCFPRGAPTEEHIKACAYHRERQLEAVAPEFLLIYGQVALQALRPDLQIKRGRGRPFLHGDIVCMAVYHPSAVLRRSLMEAPFREDLERFVKMTEAGRNRWWEFVPDRCAWCPDFVDRFDPSGIGTCVTHLQKQERVRAAQLPPPPEQVEVGQLFH